MLPAVVHQFNFSGVTHFKGITLLSF